MLLGLALKAKLPALLRAGLTSINISLDTLGNFWLLVLTRLRMCAMSECVCVYMNVFVCMREIYIDRECVYVREREKKKGRKRVRVYVSM
jgi:hypothetical protein